MTWAGVGAAVGGIGGALVNQYGGGSQGSQSGATPSNPATGYLGSLFGAGWDPKKGWQNINGGSGSIFDATTTSYLKDLMTPNPIYQGAQTAAQQGMDMASAAMPGAVAGIDTGMSWLKGLADSGPTDIDSIIAQRKYDLFHSVVPQLAETYSGLGSSGTYSSDFGGSLARSAAGMEADLGAKKYDAMEAWKTRLQQIAPTYGAMSGTRAALPASLGTDILNLGTGLRNAQQAALPGNQVLALLNALSPGGQVGNTQYYTAGYAPTSSTAGLLAGLGQSVPGIINALGQTGTATKAANGVGSIPDNPYTNPAPVNLASGMYNQP